ncbi:MAG: isochorismatase family cysteine hydrolase [Patescibacteria group bacterium]|nr:isochorismatase family cysteine hydrolase [Patescibacteria group bacterium]
MEEDKMVEMKIYKPDEVMELIVDPLNDFLVKDASSLADPEMRWILPNIVALTDELEKNGCEIVIAADSHHSEDEELERFPPHCMKGTWGAEVVDELQRFVKNDNLVIKNTTNAFMGTNLEERLARKRPKIVVITGVCSDICVIQAVITLSGLSEKFGIEKIIVPKDCITTFGDESYSAKLKDEMAFNILGATPKVEVIKTQEEI